MNQIAVIGCGDWGKNSVKTLARLHKLGALVDHPTPDKIALANQYNLKISSLEEVLASPLIKGCVIVTPTATHFPLAEACLKVGKHVFLEKPFTANVLQAEKLVSLAEKEHLSLMVGHLLRYHPAFLKVVECVQQGLVGSVITIESFRKNLGKIFPKEGILWDMGPHDLSMILTLMGKNPKKILAVGQSCFVEPYLDICSLYLDYGSIKTSSHLSRAHFQKEQRLVVTGEKGTLVFDDTKPWGEKVVFYKTYAEKKDGSFILHKDLQGTALPLSPAEPLQLELEHFVQAVEKGTKPLTDGHEALQVIKILSAAETSLNQGMWEKI
ncbi:MAG: Gfo/Idh/MocA family oxidoreductase [Alphaproteobacteria bacterium]